MKFHLKATTTQYVMLNILTLGIYFYIQQYKINNVIKVLALIKDFNLIAISTISGVLFTVVGTGILLIDNKIAAVLGIISVILGFAYTRIWAFHVRSAICYYVQKTFDSKYKPNILLTFLFPGIYLTWVINYIHENY